MSYRWKALDTREKNLMRKSGAWILSTYCKLFVKDLQILDGRTLEISKFLNFENVVLLFDPELPNKKATRFILRSNLLNKTLIYPFWVAICIRGTLKTRNFKILSAQFCSWTPNYWTKVPSDLFYGEICCIKLSFPLSESEFVWEIPLGLKILKFWVRHYLLNTKLLTKNAIRFLLW
jgi:hypothetical protein